MERAGDDEMHTESLGKMNSAAIDLEAREYCLHLRRVHARGSNVRCTQGCHA